jgi:polyhydroxybutyrate depolymerase
LAGLVLALVWAATLALQVVGAQVSHSLVSRPERLFTYSSSLVQWAVLLAAVASVFLWLGLVGGIADQSDRASIRRLALAAALVAVLSGALVSALTPAHAALDEASPMRGSAAFLLMAGMPCAVALAGAAVRRSGPILAWLSATVAVAMVWAAVWATCWSAMAGAVQPQLWAVAPVEILAGAWSAAAGLWLIGRSSGMSQARLAGIRAPGRRASAGFGLAAVLAVVSASSGFASSHATTIMAQLTGRSTVETIRVDIDRTYRHYRPADPAPKPGLVILLHGVYGSGFIMESNSRFDAQADRLGWIAAYPDGVLDGWDAFGSGSDWGHHPGADDVAFISALIGHLEKTDGVDPDRVYVTGISRGGMMSYRLGCELSGQVAAIAPVSGNMATASGSADVPCTLARPVSVLAIHGTADPTIPFAGGKKDILYSPFLGVIAKWRGWDGCSGDSAVVTAGASTTTTWTCGAANVAMRVVSGGWHTWPVSSGSSVPINPDDFDAARLIADFFVAHPRVAG